MCSCTLLFITKCFGVQAISIHNVRFSDIKRYICGILNALRSITFERTFLMIISKLLFGILFTFAVEARDLDGLHCSAESVEQANSAQLHSILAELSDSIFFRLVRVSNDGHCPLPPEGSDSLTCETVVPLPAFQFSSPSSTSLCNVETEQEVAASVVKKISISEQFAQQEFPRDNECVVEGTFSIRPDYWLDICEGFSVGEFVNLRLNPERNTGYNGSRVWAEMHASVNRLKTGEGKILSRLISGYHMSVTAQVMANYFFQSNWKPNKEKLRSIINEHPEWVENLQFAFVVMARSLFKVKPFLYHDYAFVTGNSTEDQTTKSLVRHLLDSVVLSSCGSVFVSGFDESRLFAPSEVLAQGATEFKRAFRQISRLVNCVACKRCRLHASVALHGIGVGLKILLTPSGLVEKWLSRDDIVALVDLVHKLSDSLMVIGEAEEVKKVSDWRETALMFVKKQSSRLSRVEKDTLINAIVHNDDRIELLSKTFGASSAFLRHSLIALNVQVPDVVIVGGGLAGLVTAISIAERGGSVVLLEKQSTLGGNSGKASSGINSVRSNASMDTDRFFKDTVNSQNGRGDPDLAHILVERANTSVHWLESVSKVNLSSVGILGGHSVGRTWKPEHGVVGAELMAALIREVKSTWSLWITVKTNIRVTALILDDKGVVEGVEYLDNNAIGSGTERQFGRQVVLASGGFGFDLDGLMRTYRPDLVGFPTTLGRQTTGDGIKLAAQVGAALVDMEYVQLHPTGFVDPQDPDNRVKVLAAELLRGIGGVMLNQHCERFVNELGTRKAVVDVMLADAHCPGSDCWFWLIVPMAHAHKAPNHLHIYRNRHLLQEHLYSDLPSLLHCSNNSHFPDLTYQGGNEVFSATDGVLVGKVTPVVHYTMGGVRIDTMGRVLRVDDAAIEGLFAVGEVSGGVHGENRLGGNSLLECVVFGRLIGSQSVKIDPDLSPPALLSAVRVKTSKPPVALSPLSVTQVETHGLPDDCWTIIGGKVFDLSRYAEEHPGSPGPIRESCGTDSTERFLAAHSLGLLGDVGFDPIGVIAAG